MKKPYQLTEPQRIVIQAIATGIVFFTWFYTLIFLTEWYVNNF